MTDELTGPPPMTTPSRSGRRVDPTRPRPSGRAVAPPAVRRRVPRRPARRPRARRRRAVRLRPRVHGRDPAGRPRRRRRPVRPRRRRGRRRLARGLRQLAEGQVVARGGGRRDAIGYADLDRRADVDAMVAEAMAVGRDGDPVERVDRRRADRGPRRRRSRPASLFDRPRSRADVQTLAADSRSTPDDAAVVARGRRLRRHPSGTDGQRADRTPPSERLTAALADSTPRPRSASRSTCPSVEPDSPPPRPRRPRPPPSGWPATSEIVDGKETWTIPAATIRDWITFAGRRRELRAGRRRQASSSRARAASPRTSRRGADERLLHDRRRQQVVGVTPAATAGRSTSKTTADRASTSSSSARRRWRPTRRSSRPHASSSRA